MTALNHAIQLRKLALNGEELIDRQFHKTELEEKIYITAKMQEKQNISIEMKRTTSNFPIQLPKNSNQIPNINITEGKGLLLQAKINNILTDEIFYTPATSGYLINPGHQSNITIPPGAMVTPMTTSPNDDASRFSMVKKNKNTSDLLNILKILNEKIVDIELLFAANSPILNARLEDDSIIPIALLGNGLQTILSITMVIITTPNGVVLLDEFESAIHYSKLADIWKSIAYIAKKYNTQIFAATHSLENIKYCANAMNEINFEDFQFIRLQLKKDSHIVVQYNANELNDAFFSKMEIR